MFCEMIQLERNIGTCPAKLLSALLVLPASGYYIFARQNTIFFFIYTFILFPSGIKKCLFSESIFMHHVLLVCKCFCLFDLYINTLQVIKMILNTTKIMKRTSSFYCPLLLQTLCCYTILIIMKSAVKIKMFTRIYWKSQSFCYCGPCFLDRGIQLVNNKSFYSFHRWSSFQHAPRKRFWPYLRLLRDCQRVGE